MSRRAGLAVVGAGPAGISAAIATSEAGVDTVLVDAGDAPGGQVYRPMPPAFQVTDAGALGEDHVNGESLRRALARSRVAYRPCTPVWSADGGFRLDVCGSGGRGSIEADAVIAATGTSERDVPCPGWTLPGVVGLLGAATVLLKSRRILPGEATVVADPVHWCPRWRPPSGPAAEDLLPSSTLRAGWTGWPSSRPCSRDRISFVAGCAGGAPFARAAHRCSNATPSRRFTERTA